VAAITDNWLATTIDGLRLDDLATTDARIYHWDLVRDYS